MEIQGLADVTKAKAALDRALKVLADAEKIAGGQILRARAEEKEAIELKEKTRAKAAELRKKEQALNAREEALDAKKVLLKRYTDLEASEKALSGAWADFDGQKNLWEREKAAEQRSLKQREARNANDAEDNQVAAASLRADKAKHDADVKAWEREKKEFLANMKKGK